MQAISPSLIKAKRATQLIFLVCGLGMASWAPMVPYAKDRLGLHEAQLGLLLLFLGAGALVMMPVAGALAGRFGSRAVIIGASAVMSLSLPLLLIISAPVVMAIALFMFGSGVGAVDVAMNAHGVQVQNLYGRPIMSSLHGLFSVGGLIGPLGLGFLIKLGLDPVYAATGVAALLLFIVFSQYSKLFDRTTEREAIAQFSGAENDEGRLRVRFQWLRPGVLFLGALCFAAFLSEGAMLDWSAVFLRDIKGLAPEFAGAGYAAFSVAMATMRLLGDGLVERLNSKAVVVGGSLVAAAGLLIAVYSPWIPLVLTGFVLLGIGAANIVPVFFSDAGRLKGVPPTVAIPTITTIGYAGQLAGPALLGFIAHHYELPAAFGFCAIFMVAIAFGYGIKKGDMTNERPDTHRRPLDKETTS